MKRDRRVHDQRKGLVACAAGEESGMSEVDELRDMQKALAEGLEVD